jgi:hypothetical protein
VRRENTGVFVSYEYIRKARQMLDKFDLAVLSVGYRFAHQAHRAIGRLHTNTANGRNEMDYAKHGVFLAPTENWNDEPLFYQTGNGVDDCTNVILGHTITTAPSSADAVRLFRACVLPKSLTLPDHLKHKAQHWDAYGVPQLVAIDNSSDLRARSSMLMYFLLGVIVLLIPVERGDYKGSVERWHETLFTRLINALAGSVPSLYKFTTPQQQRIIKEAKMKAKYTVAEYEAKLVDMQNTYNHEKDTRFGKPRIQIWRDAQDVAPLILPTGRLQTRAAFSLTYSVALRNEGVEVEYLKYNSPALNDLYRVHPERQDIRVDVKLEPDDVRSVIVFAQDVYEPIEAFLTTQRINFPLTLEMLRIIQRRLAGQGYPEFAWQENDYELVYNVVHELQTGPRIAVPGVTHRRDAQAATHAAGIPTLTPPGSATAQDDLAKLINATNLNERK